MASEPRNRRPVLAQASKADLSDRAHRAGRALWWIGLQGARVAVRPLEALLCAIILIAAATHGPDAVRSAVLTIGLALGVIVCYWSFVQWLVSLDAPLPPDLCKRCGRGLITRVAATRRGERFYRCESCGARYRRKLREGPWLDASAQVYDVIFSRQEQNSLGEPARFPIDESIYWTETVSSLVRNKRIRQLAGRRGSKAPVKLDFF